MLSSPANHLCRPQSLGVVCLVLLLTMPCLVDAETAPTQKPSIVFILADDLGYGDVHAFNRASRIPTPHLDRLAKGGMIFTDAHSGSAVCTPTRYGVLTGRYCWRSRLKRGVLNGYSTHLIDPNRITIASLLKQQGYHTACIGKWHLGMDFPKQGTDAEKVDYHGVIEHGPNSNGFDYFYGISASLDFPPYVYIENNRFVEPADRRFVGSPFPAYLRSGEQGRSFKHIETLDHLTEKAIAYLKRRAQAGNPFFLYFALTAPHKPVLPAPRFRGKSTLGHYGDFVMHTDWVVGQIHKTLSEAGLSENTLLMVSSDNGSFMYRLEAAECPQRLTSRTQKPVDGRDHVSDPTVQAYRSGHHRSNGPWRGTKADIWEGGHRVPFIAHWPAEISAGRRCDRTICLTDLMATAAEVAGVDLPDNSAEDSFSLLPLFRAEETKWRRAPVIHHSANGTFALRDGVWKLIAGSGSGGRGSPGSKPWSTPYQLYDMQNDAAEVTNLVDGRPDDVARLTQALRSMMESGRSR